MYVTTFYSFKGGVGRSMALANTAVSLALRGRRVLVVDFDIEAPGLDTFDVLSPQRSVPGVIDFVDQYMQTGKSPDATDYIGDCPEIGENGGKLWIMPSGSTETYISTLNQIDWLELYERNDGYLLIEDLKAQWSQILEPDYVLIDSRTGHTDSSGICTRQLPDSVVVLFFPNEQNLRGLTQVVRGIRHEAKTARRKNIYLHFVMSNVPDLDDDDQILKNKISDFKEQLALLHDPLIVHRYESLSLLNQVVFTKDRPRSRLAQEYNQIVEEISTVNTKDRDGALEYIRRAGGRRRILEENLQPRLELDSVSVRGERLTKIEMSHPTDGEILFRSAEIREADRELELAAQLVEQAIDNGYEQPEAFLKRSRFRERNGESKGAAADLWRVLESEQISPPMAREAVDCLSLTKKYDLQKIVESNAVTTLDIDGKLWLAATFNRSLDDLAIAVLLCEQIAASPDLAAVKREDARHLLGLSYMGLGRCSESASVFQGLYRDYPEKEIGSIFNYGMANWGKNGTIDKEHFEKVVKIDQSGNGGDKTANYLQCMAISYWITGHNRDAIERLDQAKKTVRSLPGRSEFSCWRYLQVNSRIFEKDVDEIQDMIERNEIRTPKFATEAGAHG